MSALLVVGVSAGAIAWLASRDISRSAIDRQLRRQWLRLKHPWQKRSAAYSAAGKDLYEIHCSTCHSLGGEGGRGPALIETTLADSELARVILSGRPGGMPPFQNTIDEEQALQIVAHIDVLGEVPVERLPGVASRGEQLYRTRGDCQSCHDPSREGGSLGPDLAGVGRRRGAAYLRLKLTHPERDVAPTYRPVRILTQEGESRIGTTVNEDTFSVQIRALDGSFHSYQKHELAAHDVSSDSSLMPSFEAVFDAGELDDLVAYLASQRTSR